MGTYKLKNDRYRKSRGGKSELLDIFCSGCDDFILLYQKDGKGRLLRMYLDRIHAPDKILDLANRDFSSVNDIANLVCGGCDQVAAVPMEYSLEKRFAYRLIPERTYKQKSKSTLR